jgi:hypothetical protein
MAALLAIVLRHNRRACRSSKTTDNLALSLILLFIEEMAHVARFSPADGLV